MKKMLNISVITPSEAAHISTGIIVTCCYNKLDYHAPKQRKIKFKARIKLDHNTHIYIFVIEFSFSLLFLPRMALAYCRHKLYKLHYLNLK